VVVVPPRPQPRPRRRTAAFRYRDIDNIGINRRIVRYVSGVREQKAQLVRAGRQRDLGLGLAGTKMKVIKIVGDRLVEAAAARRQQAGDDARGVRLSKPAGAMPIFSRPRRITGFGVI